MDCSSQRRNKSKMFTWVHYHFHSCTFNWNFIDIIVDSHVVLRNIIEIFHICVHLPSSSNVNILKKHSTTTRLLALIRSNDLIWVVCVCVCVCTHTCLVLWNFITSRVVYLPRQSKYWKIPSSQGSLVFHFYNHIQLPQPFLASATISKT